MPASPPTTKATAAFLLFAAGAVITCAPWITVVSAAPGESASKHSPAWKRPAFDKNALTIPPLVTIAKSLVPSLLKSPAAMALGWKLSGISQRENPGIAGGVVGGRGVRVGVPVAVGTLDVGVGVGDAVSVAVGLPTVGVAVGVDGVLELGVTVAVVIGVGDGPGVVAVVLMNTPTTAPSVSNATKSGSPSPLISPACMACCPDPSPRL
jgi:hypothetical protein